MVKNLPLSIQYGRQKSKMPATKFRFFNIFAQDSLKVILLDRQWSQSCVSKMTWQDEIVARVIIVSLSIGISQRLNNKSQHASIASCTGTFVYNDVTSKLIRHSSSLRCIFLIYSLVTYCNELILLALRDDGQPIDDLLDYVAISRSWCRYDRL